MMKEAADMSVSTVSISNDTAVVSLSALEYAMSWVWWVMEFWPFALLTRQLWQHDLQEFIYGQLCNIYPAHNRAIANTPLRNWISEHCAPNAGTMFIGSPTYHFARRGVNPCKEMQQGLPKGTRLQNVYCDDITWDQATRTIVCGYWVVVWLKEQSQFRACVGFNDPKQVNDNSNAYVTPARLKRLAAMPHSGITEVAVRNLMELHKREGELEDNERMRLVLVRHSVTLRYNSWYQIVLCEHSFTM
jgi:hypothetical protein